MGIKSLITRFLKVELNGVFERERFQGIYHYTHI